MLKLIHSTVRKQPDAHIVVPPDMSQEDRKRLAGLADIFFGHATPSKNTYIFTEVRGRKCWLLFQHGFCAVPDKRAKGSKHHITHLRDKRYYLTSEALACARLMEVKQVEAWA